MYYIYDMVIVLSVWSKYVIPMLGNKGIIKIKVYI